MLITKLNPLPIKGIVSGVYNKEKGTFYIKIFDKSGKPDEYHQEW